MLGIEKDRCKILVAWAEREESDQEEEPDPENNEQEESDPDADVDNTVQRVHSMSLNGEVIYN